MTILQWLFTNRWTRTAGGRGLSSLRCTCSLLMADAFFMLYLLYFTFLVETQPLVGGLTGFSPSYFFHYISLMLLPNHIFYSDATLQLSKP